VNFQGTADIFCQFKLLMLLFIEATLMLRSFQGWYILVW